MATLDISGALQAMINSTTPAAMMEQNMATAMFSNRVSDVAKLARDTAKATMLEAKALEDEGKLTPEQSQWLIECAQEEAENARRFSKRFFS
jgi:hypothetical protein